MPQRKADSRKPTITRRDFVIGGTALAASAAGLSALTGCSTAETQSSQETDTTATDKYDVNVLTVADSQISNFADYGELDEDGNYTVQATYMLPIGSQVWQASDNRAVILSTGDTSSPLSQVKMMDLDTGTIDLILGRAVSSSEGYEIYDVRASDKTLAWSEYNYMTSDWRLYATSFADYPATGEVYKLDEGDINWDSPLLCVDGERIFWTRLPYEDGLYTSGDSYLRSSDAKGGDVWDVVTSHGRFATAPQKSDGVITCTPRLDTGNVYYVLTALDPESGETVGKTTLPLSIKPMDAIHMQGTFSFCIEASYDSTSAIASMGTYRALGGGRYFKLSQTPSCTPAYCNGKLIVKYSKGTAVIDTGANQYFTISAPGYSWDYGDYLATSGTCDRFVVYSTVDKKNDVTSAYVQMRVITLE